MATVFNIKDWRNEKNERVILDVRTPSEYERGHIPDALNLPLFSDEERALVGTIYKQKGQDEALELGLEFVGTKLNQLIKTAKILAPSKKIIVHCWRGGKRSGSMAWLLSFAGFDVKVLPGGYKAYRQFARNEIEHTGFNFIVLGGKTGSGKTRILRALQQQGEQTIDLEKLANHKGSAFGWLGEPAQPTTEQFENLLFEQLLKTDSGKRIWIENESRSIGGVYLPEVFWQKMKNSPLINIEIPFEERLQTLVEDYARFPKDELLASFQKIKKRLGGQNLDAAEKAVADDEFYKAAEIALAYYDKSYQLLLENNKAPEIYQLHFDTFDPENNAISLINFCNSVLHPNSKINI